MSAVRIEALGDCALLIRFGDRIDAQLNALALAACAALQSAALPGVRDIAPAYASVCVHYDPCAWADAADGRLPHLRLGDRLRTLVDNVATQPCVGAGDMIDVPVCYGGEFGPDLHAVAEQAGMSVDEVVSRHTAANYHVAMLGFAPGFAYLLGLDPALHAPRRANPRIRVPAGSVAIGGAQTGIYPRELPGGWNLIGRTPLTLFDASRATPALFVPGQRVRLHAIEASQFRRSAA